VQDGALQADQLKPVRRRTRTKTGPTSLTLNWSSSCFCVFVWSARSQPWSW